MPSLLVTKVCLKVRAWQYIIVLYLPATIPVMANDQRKHSQTAVIRGRVTGKRNEISLAMTAELVVFTQQGMDLSEIGLKSIA